MARSRPLLSLEQPSEQPDRFGRRRRVAGEHLGDRQAPDRPDHQPHQRRREGLAGGGFVAADGPHRIGLDLALQVAQALGQLRVAARAHHDLEHRHPRRAAQHLGDHLRQAGDARAGLGDGGQQRAVEGQLLGIGLAHHEQHQVHLGGELMQHGAAADARFLGHQQGGRGRVAPRVQAGDRRLQQSAAGAGAALRLGAARGLRRRLAHAIPPARAIAPRRSALGLGVRLKVVRSTETRPNLGR